MSMYPRSIARCQHIKVNGTQCGSPSLKSERLCFFHNRWHEARIEFTRAGQPVEEITALDLPVLEDANSVQVAIMQVLRLIIAKQVDPKIAGLLLYGLQTASLNLKRANFEPFERKVVIEPNQVGNSPLGEYVWDPRQYHGKAEGDHETEEAVTTNEKAGERKPNATARPQLSNKEKDRALLAKTRADITTLLAPLAKRHQMRKSP